MFMSEYSSFITEKALEISIFFELLRVTSILLSITKQMKINAMLNVYHLLINKFMIVT